MRRVIQALLVSLAFAFGATTVVAEDRFIGFGSVTAINHFHDVSHHRISYSHPWAHGDKKSWSRPDFLRAGLGLLWRNGEHARFYSFGPVWRWEGSGLPCNCYLDAGISVAHMNNPLFHRPRDGEKEDFGNKVQFITQASLGWKVGSDERWAIALSLQHVSNGGLSEINPGADFLGIDLYRGF